MTMSETHPEEGSHSAETGLESVSACASPARHELRRSVRYRCQAALATPTYLYFVAAAAAPV